MRRIYCQHKRYKRKPLLRELCTKREKVLVWVKEKRKTMKERDYSKYDYPACIVACTCSNNTNNIYTERSAKTKIDRYQNTSLLKELLSLGQFGEKAGREGNRVGYCAEQRVAATVLKDYKDYLDLSISDLIFSKAVRPRTAKIIPYCQNCKSIFPQLNHE